MHAVQEWLGITKEEMLHKMQYERGKCAKCGKQEYEEELGKLNNTYLSKPEKVIVIFT